MVHIYAHLPRFFLGDQRRIDPRRRCQFIPHGVTALILREILHHNPPRRIRRCDEGGTKGFFARTVPDHGTSLSNNLPPTSEMRRFGRVLSVRLAGLEAIASYSIGA